MKGMKKGSGPVQAKARVLWTNFAEDQLRLTPRELREAAGGTSFTYFKNLLKAHSVESGLPWGYHEPTGTYLVAFTKKVAHELVGYQNKHYSEVGKTLVSLTNTSAACGFVPKEYAAVMETTVAAASATAEDALRKFRIKYPPQ